MNPDVSIGQQQLANATATIKPSSQSKINLINSSQLFIFDDVPTNLFGINDRDVPILIGAAVGAFGLVLIILSAILAWYCCQFGLKRQRSVYCLEDENEKWTGSNPGSGIFNDNESVIFMGIGNFSGKETPCKSQNIKRSLSAPLHSAENRRKIHNETIIIPLDLNKLTKESKYSYVNVDESLAEAMIGLEDDEKEFEKYDDDDDIDDIDDKMRYTSKSQLYMEAEETLNNLKTRSLPWRKNSTEDVSKNASNQPKINFSKKRKNRMRNDSAAAIALNRSSATNPSQLPFIHKETDSLVDNEAVVVYDERTVL